MGSRRNTRQKKNSRNISTPTGGNRRVLQVISPSLVKLYSRCPNQVKGLVDRNVSLHTLDLSASVISDVIKKIFVYQTTTNKIVKWRLIPGWVDIRARERLASIGPKEAYKEAENTLLRLSRWYNGPYLDTYNDPGIINVPIKVYVDDSTIFTDEIEVITVGDTIKMFDIRQISNVRQVSSVAIYNDLSVLARLWGLHQASGVWPTEYVRIYITPESVKTAKILIDEKLQKKCEKITEYLIHGIRNEVYYPAFSDQCIRCSYSKGCSV